MDLLLLGEGLWQGFLCLAKVMTGFLLKDENEATR